MSQPSSDTQPEDRIAQVNRFLNAELPQIQMHGGESTVFFPDPESRTVHIELSGTCSGCGLSPMTVNVLKRELLKEFNAIDNVKVSIQEQNTTPEAGTTSDAPF